MSNPARRTTTAAATLLVLAMFAGACSQNSDDPAAPASASSPGASTTPDPVATVVTTGRVTGKLPPDVRKRLADQIGEVVDGWLDAAYVGGDYPRRDFADSWPGFTSGARDQAHQDRALMSNEDLGEKIDGVEAKQRRVRIDVLAVKQRPVGVTAHVVLVFATSGEAEREVRVQGRLYLTHGDRRWRVFGYDMTKEDVR